jgi:hypothetical protein
MAANKGNMVIVDVADIVKNDRTAVLGGTFWGTAISVNSKGVNINIDGRVRSFSLARVTGLNTPPSGNVGMSTRDAAALLDMAPKAFRVHLRALGLGVGKGRTYGLTDADVNAVRAHIAG